MKKRFTPSSISTGFAFPEYINTGGKAGRRSLKESSFQENHMRGFFLLFCLCLAIAVIVIKLTAVQVVNGFYYRNLSDGNRIRTTVIHAPRGIIFDRNGTPLVFNIPGFRETKNKKTTLLTQEQAIRLLASGKDLEIDSLRQYPYKDSTAHVLGYIGQISPEEVKRPFYKDYLATDLVGKDGIEQFYEQKLKGIDGKQLSEIDATGKSIRTLGQTDPIPGQNITLTLDSKLQQAAFAAMKDIPKGAVIATTPKGEILALVSMPSFDPNLFTLGNTYKPNKENKYQTITQVLTDLENQPSLNRTISGVYPPGSTFKLITAAAGLQNNLIDASYTVEDTGILRVGAFSFANWYFTKYGRTEGAVDVVAGIKRSNDIFFYKLAELVGVEKLSDMAGKLGVGRRQGIDLEGEAIGILPTDAWKRKAIGEQWYLGDTYHYGIGQGYLLTTPLQVAMWTQGVANQGQLYTPHLLKNSKLKIRNSKFLSEENFSLIRQGMIEACEPTGVAWPLFEFKVKNAKLKIDGKNILEAPNATTSANAKDYRRVTVACKTGTAQHGGEETLPHAWITLWAPAYDPEIIVTVLAESSGEGSNIAAPVAKKVLEEWFSR